MSYMARQPTERLRGVVDRLWRVESLAEAPPSEVAPCETICPDGRTEIVLHLGDPMLQRAGDAWRAQPRHLLVTQMDGPITIVPTGHVAMVGARLVAGALHRLLPVPQHQIAGSILDLESVWRQWTRRAADRVAEAPTPAMQLAAFEDALEELVPPDSPRGADRAIDIAAARLRASAGGARIEHLAGDVGVSRRQFERRFLEHVGLSPRLFGRIIRFQRAFQSLGTETGAAIAAKCGYADQAHLVREIRRFAGQTPTLLAEAEGLTVFFRG